jgi:transcriptional regulator with XRE-family HTH domain
MNEHKTHLGPSKEWLLEMAELEDASSSVSVGGLAFDLGLLPACPSESQRVFGRLVEFSRRQMSMTVEQLAEKADIDLAEIVEIETQESVVPQARTVFQLAQVLNLSCSRLMEVAGLTTPRNEISSAALRFAARSEPTAKLSDDEKLALEEFVKVLVEASD